MSKFKFMGFHTNIENVFNARIISILVLTENGCFRKLNVFFPLFITMTPCEQVITQNRCAPASGMPISLFAECIRNANVWTCGALIARE